MSALVVIPARFASTRFPGKPLYPLNGKPLIQHVYERACGARLASEILVATDSRKILDCVVSFGGNAVMTSGRHRSGTDRVAEAASGADYDIIVNVQGDEPLIRAAMIDATIRLLMDGRASIGTLAKKITDRREILDPNVVKVAFDGEGFAVYFSRAPIPYHRDEWTALRAGEIRSGNVYKHLGIYGFRKEALLRFTALKPSRLEQIERLEQLRALENGMKIKVGITRFDAIGVDTPGDIAKAAKILKRGKNA